MTHKNVPVWVLNSYQEQINQVNQRIVLLREAGLFGLINEQVIIRDSLQYTLDGLKEQARAFSEIA